MVTIERRIWGLIRYSRMYFPNHEQALQAIKCVRPNELIRLFSVFSDLGPIANCAKHRTYLTAWVDLSVGPERILGGMKSKSCRYEIRRAEKMLDRVTIDVNSQKAREDFLNIYSDFVESKRSVPKLALRKLQDHLTHTEVLVIYLDGRPLCGHLLLCDSQAGIARLMYSASRRLQSAENAAACGALNRYLHWYEMQRYHAKGFGIYDLGGIRYPEHPTARFKLSFGGRTVTERYYLLSGSPRITQILDLLYEKLRRRQFIPSRTDIPEAPSSTTAFCTVEDKTI